MFLVRGQRLTANYLDVQMAQLQPSNYFIIRAWVDELVRDNRYVLPILNVIKYLRQRIA